MRGQDLLDQGGAGTRQPQHENGRRILAAQPAQSLEQRLVEHLEYGVVGNLQVHRVVADQPALFLVAAAVPLPGSVVVLPVLVGLGQREHEVDL